MAKLLRRLYRHAKRRIKEGLRDHRTYNLYRAACRLLAEQDHEQVSVAQLAREAKISVGAFYQRFRNKDAFLRLVIAERLDGARNQMEGSLDPARWQRSPTGFVTRAIVEQMMRDLHGPGAGVVRTALKCGHLDREHLAPLVHYRQALADRAVVLLTHRANAIRHPERAVRASVQIAVATALDALLHDAGTLRPGSGRMAATLSAMMRDSLSLSGGHAGTAQDRTDETPERADEDGMLEMPVEDVVARPIPEAPAPRQRKQRTDHAAEPRERIPLIRPTTADPPRAEETAEPSVRRRHRPRF